MEGIEKIMAGLSICSEAYTHDSCRNCPYFEKEECSGELMQEAKEAIVSLGAYQEALDVLVKECKALEDDNERLKRHVRMLKKRILKTNWHRVEYKEPPYHMELKVWTKERREYIAQRTFTEEWLSEGFMQVNGVTHWAYLDGAPKEV